MTMSPVSLFILLLTPCSFLLLNPSVVEDGHIHLDTSLNVDVENLQYRRSQRCQPHERNEQIITKTRSYQWNGHTWRRTADDVWRSIIRLWMRISYRSHVLEPSPFGVLRVCSLRVFVGRRTGPVTLIFFCFAWAMRSRQTWGVSHGLRSRWSCVQVNSSINVWKCVPLDLDEAIVCIQYLLDVLGLLRVKGHADLMNLGLTRLLLAFLYSRHDWNSAHELAAPAKLNQIQQWNTISKTGLWYSHKNTHFGDIIFSTHYWQQCLVYTASATWYKQYRIETRIGHSHLMSEKWSWKALRC